MKTRSLVAFLALGVATCDSNQPPPRKDASADAPVSVEAPPPADAQSPDAAADAGADRAALAAPDSPTSDGGTSDLSSDGARDVAPTDAVRDAGGPDSARDAGVACGNVSREMLCTTYCDGIPERTAVVADPRRAWHTALAWRNPRRGHRCESPNSSFSRQ